MPDALFHYALHAHMRSSCIRRRKKKSIFPTTPSSDATRVAATRVARAARLATNTNPNPNQSAEPRLLAAAPNQSIQHSK